MALRDNPPKWTEFVTAKQIIPSLSELQVKYDCNEFIATEILMTILREEVFLNSRYQVNIDKSVEARGFPPIWHLSVKRRDKRHFIGKDWRDLQRIKNELAGPEYEAVEIYPGEERLVDSANQYHLWVFMDREFRLPFGFTTRVIVEDELSGGFGNARQRKIER